MSYDEVEIEDMEFHEGEDGGYYTYPCPCGDHFQITVEELANGEEIARCPSCSLYITVIYNQAQPLRNVDRVHRYARNRKLQRSGAVGFYVGRRSSRQQALDLEVGPAENSLEDAESGMTGTALWSLGAHAVVTVANQAGTDSLTGDAAIAKGGVGKPHFHFRRGHGAREIWTLVVLKCRGFIIAILPAIPEIFRNEHAGDLASVQAALTEKCWSGTMSPWGVRAAAALTLLDLMVDNLPGVSHYHGEKSKQYSKEAEACASALRSFVVANIPFGSFTGVSIIEDQRHRQSQGTTSNQPFWAQLPSMNVTGTKERLLTVVAEEVDARIPSNTDDNSPVLSSACCLHGRITVILDSKIETKVSLPVTSDKHTMEEISVEHCADVQPSWQSLHPMRNATLFITPELSVSTLVARYVQSQITADQLPFTARYAVSSKQATSGKQAMSFSMQLAYHPPSEAAVVDHCTVTFPYMKEVTSIEAAISNTGLLSVQNGVVVWYLSGSGRISSRNRQASCSGLAILSDRNLDESMVQSRPEVSGGQTVKGCYGAPLEFLLKNCSLTGVTVDSKSITIQPSRKELLKEVTTEVRSRDYIVWSLPAAKTS